MNVDRSPLPSSPRHLWRMLLLTGLLGVLAACGGSSDSSGTTTTMIDTTSGTDTDPTGEVDGDIDGEVQVMLTAALVDELGLEGVDGESEEQPVTIDGTGLSEEQRQAVIAASQVEVAFVEPDADPAEQRFWSIDAPEGRGEQLITLTLNCEGHCMRQPTYRVIVGEDQVKVLELDSLAIE